MKSLAPAMIAEATHDEWFKGLDRAARSRHISQDHGKEYGPEWRSRIPNGFGYEFSDWHTEIHGTACAGCGHREHGRACSHITDNGWTWHGCHCGAE